MLRDYKILTVSQLYHEPSGEPMNGQVNDAGTDRQLCGSFDSLFFTQVTCVKFFQTPSHIYAVHISYYVPTEKWWKKTIPQTLR